MLFKSWGWGKDKRRLIKYAKRLTLEQYHKAWINLSQGKVIEVKSPHASVRQIEKEMQI